MKKRGQLQLSFGMIFSIIIIIATVAVAFYVISYFVNLTRCFDTGGFYKSLQDEVDKAWSSPITKKTFEQSVSKGTEEICFGDLKVANTNSKEYLDLRNFINREANVFVYPNKNACGDALEYYNLKHAQIDGFFCIQVVNEKVKIQLNKDFDDALVKISG